MLEMDDSIIYKYLSGIATEKEKVQLKDWLNQSPEHCAYFFDIKAIRNAQRVTKKIDEEGIEDSLARMNKRIHNYNREVHQNSDSTVNII